MNESTTDIRTLPLPTGQGVLTEVLRGGARRLLGQAVEAAAAAWIQARAHPRDDAGRQHVVRNGYLPERTIQTGIGPLEVQQPRVRDRRPADQREAFKGKHYGYVWAEGSLQQSAAIAIKPAETRMAAIRKDWVATASGPSSLRLTTRRLLPTDTGTAMAPARARIRPE